MAKVSNKILNNIKKYLNEINKICPIDKAYLFGSYVKGSQNKNSDIDLAIFSRKITDKNQIEYMILFFTKISGYNMDLQPIAFSLYDYFDDGNDFIKNEIKNRGVEIKV